MQEIKLYSFASFHILKVQPLLRKKILTTTSKYRLNCIKKVLMMQNKMQDLFTAQLKHSRWSFTQIHIKMKKFNSNLCTRESQMGTNENILYH